MADCLFCKMVAGEIKPDVVYDNEFVLAFRDLNPQAPVHILIIPKKHIASIDDIADEDRALMGEIMLAVKHIARAEGLSESGYRTVFNCKHDGGQEVYHIHLHLMGGRQMQWPPG